MVRDVPLGEITLRRYERPFDHSKRELIRKICLSLGLLQPGDSRDVVVDILLSLEESRKERKELSSTEIIEKVIQIRKDNSLGERGIAESNVRRQLKRLRDLMLVDKKQNMYRLSEFESLSYIFKNKIESFLIPETIERIKEYLGKLDEE
ncbi:hypothetical protein CXX78_01035 [Candidatus Parvarchaeota archaeon]|nr:MAG: hypothetical protein CXX78_01035 [Candidatus Parvarchaeota archaeon]